MNACPGAGFVHACEWNPAAQQALSKNLEANGVSARCLMLPGDCRLHAPKVSHHLILVSMVYLLISQFLGVMQSVVCFQQHGLAVNYTAPSTPGQFFSSTVHLEAVAGRV